MTRATLNVFLLLAFVLTVGLNWMGPPDFSRRNADYFPNMARSPRYNGYSPNPNFPDGKTLQPPVPGTEPRGYVPLHYTASAVDAVRSGEELTNPFQASDQRAFARGASVFANFCQACHGAGGSGNGPVSLRGFPAPPSLLDDHARNLKDGQIFHILTFGQKNMPSYAAQVSTNDRWKVILHVRSLQTPAPPAPAAASPPAPAPPGGGGPVATHAVAGGTSSGGQP